MGVIENAKEVAELIKKYNDVELNRRIVNLEVEVAELQRDKIRLEAQVAELQGQLRLKAAMEFKPPYYWQAGDETPFCPKCWEANRLTVHLSLPAPWGGGVRRDCISCGQAYFEEESKSKPKPARRQIRRRW